MAPARLQLCVGEGVDNVGADFLNRRLRHDVL